ncbi:curlin repeat-containing protein [Jannaschia sp. KMU-145]|uniref:curlin repeat-containing protein n=1 Tax=Jannaschia halovivens TaxID=3388667 RepID=UPI00396B02FD
MVRVRHLLAACCVVALSAPAGEANENVLIRHAAPEANTLRIVEAEASRVTVVTRRSRSAARPDIGAAGPAEGLIVQTGLSHSVVLDVAGQSNLFDIVQSGRGQSVTGAITGTANRAIIAQSGQGQTVVFRQTGAGNNLSVRQSSW